MAGVNVKNPARSNWIRMYLNITVDVPCVFRDNEALCSVRFFESQILRRHPVMVPRDVILKYCFEDSIAMYGMTAKECKYFNTLAPQFNMAWFDTTDKLFLMTDVIALWKFVTIAATASNGVNSLTNIAGFVRMTDNIILPYVISSKENKRYVPTFFFEDSVGVINEGVMKTGNVQGSLLTYLKLCCYILGVRIELVAGKSCKVVNLDQAKEYLPPGVTFEDVWPMTRVMEKVEVVDESSASLDWLIYAKEEKGPK